MPLGMRTSTLPVARFRKKSLPPSELLAQRTLARLFCMSLQLWSRRTEIMFIQLAWLWLETKLFAALPVGSLGRFARETNLRMFCDIGLRRFDGITLPGKSVRVPPASAAWG